MKTVRILLLVLLAMLLPFRGVVAAAVPVADAADGSRIELRLHQHSHLDSHLDSHAAHCESGHAHGAHGEHEHPFGGWGECSLCAASCSTSSLMSAVPTLAPPVSFVALEFPSLHVPAPSFLSDGQERPPRSL